jgi:hypothetical protein
MSAAMGFDLYPTTFLAWQRPLHAVDPSRTHPASRPCNQVCCLAPGPIAHT